MMRKTKLNPTCYLLILFIISVLSTSCNKTIKNKNKSVANPYFTISDTLVLKATPQPIELKSLNSVSDTTFIDISKYHTNFEYDLRYATKNNFLKEKVYDCAECYTRAKTAKVLIQVSDYLIEKGYKIKFFDCYRPNSVQYKMWEIMPNSQYVARPKKGSIHNKGGAVDITLTDLNGNDLDMGTDFDFFGWRAYHTNSSLPAHVLANRKLLKETMKAHGFWSIRTEWWHYNLKGTEHFKVANFKWKCE